MEAGVWERRLAQLELQDSVNFGQDATTAVGRDSGRHTDASLTRGVDPG